MGAEQSVGDSLQPGPVGLEPVSERGAGRSPVPVRPMRISIAPPWRAAGMPAATSTAASMSSASNTRYPPTGSAYGPSTVTSVPSTTRTVFAFSARPSGNPGVMPGRVVECCVVSVDRLLARPLATTTDRTPRCSDYEVWQPPLRVECIRRPPSSIIPMIRRVGGCIANLGHIEGGDIRSISRVILSRRRAWALGGKADRGPLCTEAYDRWADSFWRVSDDSQGFFYQQARQVRSGGGARSLDPGRGDGGDRRAGQTGVRRRSGAWAGSDHCAERRQDADPAIWYWPFVGVGFFAWSVGASVPFRDLLDVTEKSGAFYLALSAAILPSLDIGLEKIFPAPDVPPVQSID